MRQQYVVGGGGGTGGSGIGSFGLKLMVVKIGRHPSLSLIQSAKFQLILLNNY